MESSCQTGPTARCHLAGPHNGAGEASRAERRGRCGDIKEFAGRHQEPRALSSGEPEFLPLLHFFRTGVTSLKCN